MIAAANVVRYLFSAGGLTCLVVSAALWMAWSRQSRAARRFLFAVAAIFGASSLYGPQYLLARAISYPLKPFTAPDGTDARRTALIVLGSGSVDVKDWQGRTFSFVDRTAAARVLEAARIFKQINPAIVVASGGDPSSDRDRTPTAETMRDALITLGVPADRIMTETASKTTQDEAVIVADILRAQNVDRAILVTSRTHMRRALGTFRAAGVDAVPAIAQEFDADIGIAQMILPSQEGLSLAATNVHEILGLGYYWLRGWWRSSP